MDTSAHSGMPPTPTGPDKSTCTKCGKTFTSLRDLARETPCVVIGPPNATNNVCEYCGHAYAHSFHLTRHLKSCRMKNRAAPTPPDSSPRREKSIRKRRFAESDEISAKEKWAAALGAELAELDSMITATRAKLDEIRAIIL